MFSRPPGWGEPGRDPADAYADTRGELIAGERSSPTARAANAALCQLWVARPPRARPRPVSTEGGQGRAVPGRGHDAADVLAAIELFTAVADPGAEAAWTRRPKR